MCKNFSTNGWCTVRRESFLASYKRLWRTLVALRCTHPEVLWFLLAAAIFRDGLAGVFTYGEIIAQRGRRR